MFSRPGSVLVFVLAGHLLAFPAASVLALQNDEQPASSEEIQVGALIDFARDVWPIFNKKCLHCHGPEDAKNGFRVDEEDSVLAYLEPHDLESSSLWVDYLVTDDPNMRMPPPSDEMETALTGAELAIIKVWIEEGAAWQDLELPSEPVKEVVVPASFATKLWLFQGLFHPATVHFPIALLTVSAGFTLLSFFRPQTCEPVAFHCLWIGALGAVVASASGWSYAVHEGYGTGFGFNLRESAIDRHRWLGVATAVVAILLIPMAVYVRRTGDVGMRIMWLLGALFLVASVSITGFQGGELTYGEGHYEKEFLRLFPPQTISDEAELDNTPPEINASESETADESE